ncbi:MAG: AbrB/MazE/SpoVT family DNA-binding domain-containing protein [Microbacteriaceae bacterium]|nr:AbrB/MazE/SpoVT family DNA-binding domain-containing protein [Microbacteriaceae bacterium]
MSATTAVRVGSKGRIIVPAEIRERRGWTEGSVLVAVEKPEGVLLMTRDEALDLLRVQAGDRDVVGEFLEERRAAGARERAELAS